MGAKAAASEGFGREALIVLRSAPWDLIFFSGCFRVLCVAEEAGREYVGLHRAQVSCEGGNVGLHGVEYDPSRSCVMDPRFH